MRLGKSFEKNIKEFVKLVKVFFLFDCVTLYTRVHNFHVARLNYFPIYLLLWGMCLDSMYQSNFSYTMWTSLWNLRSYIEGMELSICKLLRKFIAEPVL